MNVVHVFVIGLLLGAAVTASAKPAQQLAQDVQEVVVELPAATACASKSFVKHLVFAIKWWLGQPQAATVAELAQHAPGNMSILINALNRADLQGVIADPNFEGTILAPTNQAFRVALLKLKLTPQQLYADKTALTNILSYHTIPGKALAAADLKDGQTLTTINQQPLTVHVDQVAGTSIQGGEEVAKVVAADIRAGKAIVHVIDTVLLPPKPSTSLSQEQL